MQREKKNLYQLLSDLTTNTPEKPLFKESDNKLNATDLLQKATSAANIFSSLGIRRGTLAALYAVRGITTAVLLLGLRLAGALIVLCDPRQTPNEIQRECETDLPIAFFIRPSTLLSATVTRYPDMHKTNVSLLSSQPCLPLFDSNYNPQAASFLLFTSGSTGAKKAVVLSESNLIVDLLVSQPLGFYSPNDIALGALPLDHIFGLVLLLGVIVLGYELYFPPHTDVRSLLSAVEQERITRMNGVPSLYLKMTELAGEYDLSSLRAGFIAGGPVTATQFIEIESKLGITLISVYGMTECIGISCSNWRDPQSVRASGVGPFYAVNRGKIVLEDGSIARTGQIGEIHVKGPMCMLGYYGQTTAKSSWLQTGDLGFTDAGGVLHLCGRKKEIIIRNGYNLSAARIENALLSLPTVKVAAVIGVPDESQGEVPYALIVGHAESEQLTELLHKNELPVKIISVPQLPMTPLGKPDKKKIREAFCS